VVLYKDFLNYAPSVKKGLIRGGGEAHQFDIQLLKKILKKLKLSKPTSPIALGLISFTGSYIGKSSKSCQIHKA
jgi:hypothetical protein